MKLQPDKSYGLTINATGPGWLEVNGHRHTQSLIVSSHPQAQPEPWRPTDFNGLCAADFEHPAFNNAELVIFGSGKRLQFVRAAWVKGLIAQGVGVESMDTAAACRTYNILASEGRKVTAALLMEPKEYIPNTAS